MGNSSSHTHQPLDRGFTRGTFGDVRNSKAASFRFSKRSPKRMERIRRSFRDSFRRRKDRVPESSKPHQWQSDAEAVRSATCSFPVKYLGCVEVFESRGMNVCEEALKVLRSSRRRTIRGLLHVSGDGLRVVDDDTKGLIVDQTIEKVSFCAPDRNHERGFSYICRDGTTRRWMCHGFLASKDSGERLSHAVGCAFTVCLERKQRRDTECSVTMTFDTKNSTFTRNGSFRQTTMTERLHHHHNERGIDTGNSKTPSAIIPPQPKPHLPFAIERPHATPSMLERQGSFRGLSALNSHHSPFKRQMSLRLNDLPSNAERQKSFLEPLTNGHSIRTVSPIPEVMPNPQQQIDKVSDMCKQISQGLSLLSSHTDTGDELNFNLQTVCVTTSNYVLPSTINSIDSLSKIINTTQSAITAIESTTTSTTTPTPIASISPMPIISTAAQPTSDYLSMLPTSTVAPIPVESVTSPSIESPSPTKTAVINSIVSKSSPTSPTTKPASNAVAPNSHLPKADQWLGHVVKSTSPSPRRAPAINLHARARSLNTDPFDADWVNRTITADDDKQSTSLTHHNTNPFISPPKPPAQSFQVQL